MKKIGVGILITITSFLLFVYLLNNISPWDEPKVNNYIKTFEIKGGKDFDQFVQDSIDAGIIIDYLDIKNVVVLTVNFTVFITAFLASVHMLIDKLFFKKFYEEPDHWTAYRRMVWIPLMLIIVNAIRLAGGFNFLTGFTIFLIILFIGLVEYNLVLKKKQNKPQIEQKAQSDAIIQDNNLNLNHD